MEIVVKVHVDCPDLTLAVTALAKILQSRNHPCESISAQTGNAASAQPPVNPTAAATPVTTTPGAAQTAPTAVPTSPAPQITGDMVAKAGADLLAQNPAAMPQLMGLLQKYGVGCAQELKPDQIGPFATEMRALGAKI